MELEEFRRILIANAGAYRRKGDEDFKGKRFPFTSIDDDDNEQGDKLVCVTGGVSFLGLAIVDRLLTRGYSVRILVDNPGN